MLEFIFLIGISLIFFAIAYQLCIKGNIKLLHSYHYKKVPVQLYKAYTFVMGVAMLSIGISIIVFAVMKLVGIHSLAVPVLLSGASLGLGIFVAAQYKYNGGIF